jgi:RNA polymerase sigma factor (sigma-70 family)
MSTQPSSSAPAAEATALSTPPAEQTQWFKSEVHPHGAQLKSFLRGRYPSVRDVDDVVQESYLRIWKAKSLHQIASAKAFLFRIAKNLAINHVRRERISPLEEGRALAELSVLDIAPNAADALVAQDTLELLADAIATLPPRTREVLYLHKLRGLTQRETGEKLGISERTVEKHSNRGMTRCEEYLRAHGIQDSIG